MANAFVGTAELLKIGDGTISDISVSDVLEGAPLLAAMISGPSSHETTHKWLKKTAAPATGFRAINDGRENVKATYTEVTETLKLYDAGFDVDMGLLRTGSGEQLFRREAIDHLSAAMADMERQIIYGTGNQAGGFEGLADQATVDALADPMVINATGTTVGGATSVWAIRTGENAVSGIFANDGQITLGERSPILRAGSSTGSYDAERQPIMFWGALQVASVYDVGRIVNLTAQSGKGLTDVLLSQLYATFPASMKPTHFVMGVQSVSQLQQSRTTYSPTGSEAPYPMNWNNVPIIVTDQIGVTEAIVA